MPPDRLAPEDPREWLNRARSNLARARTRLAEVYFEDLCFDAQQAAEKALKALLIARSMRFPFVHDIGDLVGRLERNGERIPEEVREAVLLTDYAVETRYPGPTEAVEEPEYVQAVALAEAVVRWVEERLRGDS